MPEEVKKTTAALTKENSPFPGYVNVSKYEDGSVVIIVRSDPEVIEKGAFVCGYQRDKGQYGRCTPGDEHCNNYCNRAPEKGPMSDSPKTSVLHNEAETARLVLSQDDWQELLNQMTEIE